MNNSFYVYIWYTNIILNFDCWLLVMFVNTDCDLPIMPCLVNDLRIILQISMLVNANTFITRKRFESSYCHRKSIWISLALYINTHVLLCMINLLNTMPSICISICLRNSLIFYFWGSHVVEVSIRILFQIVNHQSLSCNNYIQFQETVILSCFVCL